MRRGVAALAGAALLLAAGSGSAQDFARTGFYVGVGGTVGLDRFQDAVESELDSGFQLSDVGASGEFRVRVEEAFGGSARLGYRFHRHLALEAQAEYLAGFEGEIRNRTPSGQGVVDLGSFEVEPVTVTGNLKANLLTGSIQPFVLVGVGAMFADVRVRDPLGLGLPDPRWESAFALRYGGGIDLYTTEHVVLSVSIDYVRGLEDELSDSIPFPKHVAIGWGLQYRF